MCSEMAMSDVVGMRKHFNDVQHYARELENAIDEAIKLIKTSGFHNDKKIREGLRILNEVTYFDNEKEK